MNLKQIRRQRHIKGLVDVIYRFLIYKFVGKIKLKLGKVNKQS